MAGHIAPHLYFLLVLATKVHIHKLVNSNLDLNEYTVEDSLCMKFVRVKLKPKVIIWTAADIFVGF